MQFLSQLNVKTKRELITQMQTSIRSQIKTCSLILINSMCFEGKSITIIGQYSSICIAPLQCYKQAKNEKADQQINQDRCNASINNVIFAVNNLTDIANKMMPKNLRII